MPKTDQNLDAFRRYRESLDKALDMVEESLDGKDYATACDALAAVTKSTAKVSVGMRSALIRQGHLKEES